MGARPLERVPCRHERQEVHPVTAQPERNLRIPEQACEGSLDDGSGEGLLSRQAFEEDESQRIDITASDDRGTLGLLGAQVVGGPDRGTRGCRHGGIDHPRDPEVGELRVHAGVVVAGVEHQDIRGLDVPVYHPLCMDVGEGIGKVGSHLGHFRRLERALLQ